MESVIAAHVTPLQCSKIHVNGYIVFNYVADKFKYCTHISWWFNPLSNGCSDEIVPLIPLVIEEEAKAERSIADCPRCYSYPGADPDANSSFWAPESMFLSTVWCYSS